MTNSIDISTLNLKPGESAYFFHEVKKDNPKREPQRKQKPKCIHLGGITNEVYPPADGLGDMIERRLISIGITKEKWAEFVGSAEGQKAAGCGGCDRRQKIINIVGSYFGIGTNRDKLKTILEVLQLEEGTHLQVYQCALHNKCLPQSLPTVKMEGMPMVCKTCRKENLGYQAMEEPCES